MKSMHGGQLSHDLNMLSMHQSSELLILHTVVAYGVLDWRHSDHAVWTLSMYATIFSVAYAAKDLAYCATVWTEHMAHASRFRFMRSCSGESLRQVTLCFNQLSNPVFFTTILLGSINKRLPQHVLGFNYETFYMSSFVVGALASWYLIAIIVPHFCFLGRMPRLSEHMLIDLPMHLVVCNVSGEAPTHRKRHPWSARFHLYKFIIQIVWKLALMMATCILMPDIWTSFKLKSSLATNITPEIVIRGVWAVGAAAAGVLEFVMLIIAQFGLAFPGLSFFADASRTIMPP